MRILGIKVASVEADMQIGAIAPANDIYCERASVYLRKLRRMKQKDPTAFAIGHVRISVKVLHALYADPERNLRASVSLPSSSQSPSISLQNIYYLS